MADSEFAVNENGSNTLTETRKVFNDISLKSLNQKQRLLQQCPSKMC
jgi:hypothetical protein